MSQMSGKFIISLDFELFWGMHDVSTLKEYGKNIIGARSAVKEILKSFKEYNIHATWAIVGMLYCQDINQLQKLLPKNLPDYHNKELSPYDYIRKHPISNEEKSLFFAPNLIKKIIDSEHQEIATHTFSHFYTLEKGATKLAFSDDLEAALSIADKNDCYINSIVFPRNQINESFLQICVDNDITSYRGTEDFFIYNFYENYKRKYHIRAMRLLDQYINLFGHHTYTLNNTTIPINLASSRYLMPYNKKRKWLEPLKLRRIKNAMTYAAKNNEIYHLWWHPHNFGSDLTKNMKILHSILEHYTYLHHQYQFQSMSMKEITESITVNKTKKYKY